MKPIKPKDLEKITGGSDPTEITVKIKTLEGEDDPYMIPLSDDLDEILAKYQTEKKTLS